MLIVSQIPKTFNCLFKNMFTFTNHYGKLKANREVFFMFDIKAAKKGPFPPCAEVSREAAREGFVLLKNNNGDNADNTEDMLEVVVRLEN